MSSNAGKLLAMVLMGLLTACAGPPNRAPVVGEPSSRQLEPGVDANGFYVVKPGDTLYSIALEYGLDWRELAKANGMTDPSRLAIGQRLVIQNITPATSTASAGGQVEVKPVSPNTGSVDRPSRIDPPSAPSEPVASSDQNLGFIWPHNGSVVQQYKAGVNKGIDIAAKVGDPVIASLGGKVVYSGNALRGYGNLIIIKHDNNLLTAYAHNQTLLVKEGDTVNKGQRIAEAGQSDADRPKLHFEVRKQGKPVNPMDYLPSR